MVLIPKWESFWAPAVGAVAADDDEAVDAVSLQDSGRLLLYLGLYELGAAGCLQNRAAAGNDIGNRMGVHINDFFLEQARIASPDALDGAAVCQALADDGTDGCVHAGRITA